ncbi:MAG: glycosyltransferase [Chloroflexota bacterium]|nr:glycosyltransferase [Chloroflexota bacterium]
MLSVWSNSSGEESRPRVSIVISAYLSHATIGSTLSALRAQTFCDFETIVVDSSPDDRTRRIAAAYPGVKVVASPTRLTPCSARNRGIALARGDLIVCTDPDAYPEPTWLSRLVAEHERTGGIVAGACRCFGDRWLDHGIHFVKFAALLPRRSRRAAVAGTVNCLLPRWVFEALGPFSEEVAPADALFSWRAAQAGLSITFAPDAVVYHHHLDHLRAIVQNRLRWGNDLARARTAHFRWSRGRSLLWALLSFFPVRLMWSVLRDARRAAEARLLRRYLVTLPVYLAGTYATLVGEACGYFRRAVRL